MATRPGSTVLRVLREPLLHFLLLGGLVFASFQLANAGDVAAAEEIVVTKATIDQLAGQFARTWQRPPTEQELDALIDELVREEVLYRAALEMGLDRDDPVIRRRLRQKVEFMTQDLAEQVEPTDEQLRAYVAAHADSFRSDPRFTYRQVYLSPERRKDQLEADVKRLLAELPTERVDEKTLAARGDPFLLPLVFRRVERREVRATFGDGFARSLAELAVGKWHGPVRSGYGVHLVFVEERIEARMPELAEIRAAAVREWMAANRRKTQDEFYRRLRGKYEVRVER